MPLKKLVLGGAVLALVMTAIGPGAEARTGGRWKRIPVQFQPVNVVDEDAGSICDASGQCVAQSRSRAGETGDLEGTAIQADSVGFGTTSVAVVNSSGAYTGSIKGCGTGTFLYEGRTRADVTTGYFEAEYPVVAGTGTGDFEGLTGVFHQEGTLASGIPPLHGWVRCKVRS